MKILKLKKAAAERMAEDVRQARRKILRRAEPEETYELMILIDAIEESGRMEHLESLANHLESGRHFIQQNLEVSTAEEAQEIANEMAEDLRVLRSHTADLQEEPLTEERLRRAEEIFRRYGVELKLLDRASLPTDTHFN